MSKTKASRRAISIRGETYKRVQEYCGANGFTISGLIEGLVAHFFENLPVGDPSRKKPSQEIEIPTPTKPFELKSLKKEELPPAKHDPIRGGGIHSL